MNQTIRFGLPLLGAGQAQKEVTHNEALLAIDRRLHPVVESRCLATPPAQPVAGSAFIIPTDAAGAWAGGANSIASFDGFGWDIATPTRGTVVWIADERCFSVFDGAWSSRGFPARALDINGRIVLGAEPVVVAEPTGGDLVDANCRAAFGNLITALRAQGVIL